MIWPFKKREPEIPFSEFVKTLAPAPCGEQETHYQWEIGGALPCPACIAIRKRREKDAELNALADKIVARLHQMHATKAAEQPEQVRCTHCDWTGPVTAAAGFATSDCPRCLAPVSGVAPCDGGKPE